MMKRSQIYLDESLLSFLEQMSREKKTTISDLIRKGVERVYGKKKSKDGLLKAFHAVQGIWEDRTDLPSTKEYIRSLRKDTRRQRLGIP